MRRDSLPVLALGAVLGLLIPSAACASTGFAYIGPGPGLDFVPYFFSLLGWIVFALSAVLVWPVSALWSRVRRGRVDRASASTPAQGLPVMPAVTSGSNREPAKTCDSAPGS